MTIFLKAILCGFAIAAPIGPASLLTMRRSVASGVRGIFSGLGAVTADVVHAALAIFGVAAVIELLATHGDLLRGIAGVALFGIAAVSFRKRREETPGPISAASLASDWASSLALTVMNPGTLLGFIAIFAGLGVVVAPDTPVGYLTVIAGVLLGSVVWWVGLAVASRAIGARLSPRHLTWIDRGTGVLFAAGGTALLITAIF
jgi:threonine/homoserine/homoserine lactone efflux protein